MTKAQSTRTVGEVMTACPRSVRYDQTLAEASALMSEHAVRHLPVLKDGGVVGVLSDRDVAVIESLAATPPERIRVVEAMTPVPYAVPAGTPLVRVVRRMAAEKYGCAIVTDASGRDAIGIFTTTDALGVLRTLLAE
jgi:acetoin utilization protein AcuB